MPEARIGTVRGTPRGASTAYRARSRGKGTPMWFYVPAVIVIVLLVCGLHDLFRHFPEAPRRPRSAGLTPGRRGGVLRGRRRRRWRRCAFVVWLVRTPLFRDTPQRAQQGPGGAGELALWKVSPVGLGGTYNRPEKRP